MKWLVGFRKRFDIAEVQNPTFCVIDFRTNLVKSQLLYVRMLGPNGWSPLPLKKQRHPIPWPERAIRGLPTNCNLSRSFPKSLISFS